MPIKSPGSRISLPFQLLKSFTEKELNHFEKLINSGYLSAKQGLDLLLKSLKRHALHHDNFTPQLQCTVYGSLYSQEKTDTVLNDKQKKKLSKAMTNLLTLAEKFLMFEKIKGTDDHDSTLLFPELIDRKQLLLYSRRVKATEKKLSQEKKPSADHYTKNYLIQAEKARLYYITNALVKEDNYDEYQYYLDVKYILEKLNLHLMKITVLNIYADRKFDLSPYKAIKKLLKLPQYFNNTLIYLSLLNIELVQKDDDNTFFTLLDEIVTQADKVPANNLKRFYSNLSNYCIRQEAKGRLEFTKYLFEIYNYMDKGKLLLKNDSIDVRLLKNLITYACRVNEFDWAYNKLAFYIEYVSKDVRNDVFTYNRGVITFNQQNYTDTLSLLAKVKKIDHTYDLGLRMIQLQCFYETDYCYEESTQQMINSLKAFVKENKKLVKKQKTAYLNFLFVFNKLYKLKDTPDKLSLQSIIDKVLPEVKKRLFEYDLIREKKWLLHKIKILENG